MTYQRSRSIWRLGRSAGGSGCSPPGKNVQTKAIQKPYKSPQVLVPAPGVWGLVLDSQEPFVPQPAPSAVDKLVCPRPEGVDSQSLSSLNHTSSLPPLPLDELVLSSPRLKRLSLRYSVNQPLNAFRYGVAEHRIVNSDNCRIIIHLAIALLLTQQVYQSTWV